METGIYLIYFHWENGIWVTRGGNHKPKNGNGVGIRTGIWAKYRLARKLNLVEIWAGDEIYTFPPFLTFCAKHSEKLTNERKNTLCTKLHSGLLDLQVVFEVATKSCNW